MRAEHQASHACPALSVYVCGCVHQRGSGLAWWPLWLSLVPQEAEFLPRL